MKQLVYILLLILTSNLAVAQDTTAVKYKDTINSTPVIVEIINGDTIRYSWLEEIVVIESDSAYKVYQKKYRKTLRRIKKVYPLMLVATENINTFDGDIEALERKRKQRKYIKEANKELKENFAEMIKKMSISEGKILVKLIHRETGLTAYEVIKKYKGGMSAWSWQVASKIGGADLKLTYDATGEDKMIEDIVLLIESGEIKINPHQYASR